MSSVIASDSSFEHRLEMLDEDKEDKELLKAANEKMNERLAQNTTCNISADQKTLLNDTKKQEKKQNEPLKVDGADPDEPPIEIIEEPIKKGKKKKKKKKSGKRKQGSSGPEAKF